MATTLHAQVAQQLMEAIAAGHFPVGALLPTEMALCEQYGASRSTVRQALQELQAMGLVSRKKRVGTRVESASPTGGYSQSLASLDGLVQLAAHQVRVIQRARETVMDQPTARALGCSPGSRWLCLDMLRLHEDGRDDEPVGWTQMYLDPRYGRVPDLLRRSPKTLVSTLIESKYGRRVAEVEQAVQAVALDEASARRFAVPVGSPGLKITRRYLDQAGKPFEITVTLHPADRMICTTRLRRDRA